MRIRDHEGPAQGNVANRAAIAQRMADAFIHALENIQPGVAQLEALMASNLSDAGAGSANRQRFPMYGRDSLENVSNSLLSTPSQPTQHNTSYSTNTIPRYDRFGSVSATPPPHHCGTLFGNTPIQQAASPHLMSAGQQQAIAYTMTQHNASTSSLPNVADAISGAPSFFDRSQFGGHVQDPFARPAMSGSTANVGTEPAAFLSIPGGQPQYQSQQQRNPLPSRY